MGLDFIRAAAPGFNRVLDRRLVEMHTPKLFTRDLPIVSRTARAELCQGVIANVGERNSCSVSLTTSSSSSG